MTKQRQFSALVPQEGERKARHPSPLTAGENRPPPADFRRYPWPAVLTDCTSLDLATLPRLPPETPLMSRRDSYADKLWRRRRLVYVVLVALAATGARAESGEVARDRLAVVDG